MDQAYKPGEAGLPETVIDALAAYRAKDLDTFMSNFAADAVVYDPHYPLPLMEGRDAIRYGIGLSLASIDKPGFTVVKHWDYDDGSMMVVDTHHLFHSGQRLEFEQLYFVRLKDDKIIELRAFVPYHPPRETGLRARWRRWLWHWRND